MSAPVTQEQLEHTVNNLNNNIIGTANNLNANLIGTANNLQANQNGLHKQILNLNNESHPFTYAIDEYQSIIIKAKTINDLYKAFFIYQFNIDPIEATTIVCMLSGQWEKFFTKPKITPLNYAIVFSRVFAFIKMQVNESLENNQFPHDQLERAKGIMEGYNYALYHQSNEFLSTHPYADVMDIQTALLLTTSKTLSAIINPLFINSAVFDFPDDKLFDSMDVVDASSFITIGKKMIDESEGINSYSAGSGHWYNLGLFNGFVGRFFVEDEEIDSTIFQFSSLNQIGSKVTPETGTTYPRKHVGPYLLVEIDPIGHPNQYKYKGEWKDVKIKNLEIIKRNDGGDQTNPTSAIKIIIPILLTEFGFINGKTDVVSGTKNAFVDGGFVKSVLWLTDDIVNNKILNKRYKNKYDSLYELRTDMLTDPFVAITLNEGLDATYIDKFGNVMYSGGKVPNVNAYANQRVEHAIFHTTDFVATNPQLNNYLRKQWANSRDMGYDASDSNFDLTLNYALGVPWKRIPEVSELSPISQDFMMVANHIYSQQHPWLTRLNSSVNTIQSISHGNYNFLELYSRLIGTVDGVDGVFEKTRLSKPDDYVKIMRQYIECGPLTSKGLNNWTLVFKDLGLLSISEINGSKTVLPISEWESPPKKYTRTALEAIEHNNTSYIAQCYLPTMLDALKTAIPLDSSVVIETNGLGGSDMSDITQTDIDDALNCPKDWHSNGCKYDLDSKGVLLWQSMNDQVKRIVAEGMKLKYDDVISKNSLTSGSVSDYSALVSVGAWACFVWDIISLDNTIGTNDFINQSFPNLTLNTDGTYSFTEMTEDQQKTVFRNRLLRPNQFNSGLLTIYDPFVSGTEYLTGAKLINYALITALHCIKLMKNEITIWDLDKDSRPTIKKVSNETTLAGKIRREWQYCHQIILPFDNDEDGVPKMVGWFGHIDGFSGGGLKQFGRWFADYSAQSGGPTANDSITTEGINGDKTPYGVLQASVYALEGKNIYNYTTSNLPTINTRSIDTNVFLKESGFTVWGQGDLAYNSYFFSEENQEVIFSKVWTANMLNRKTKYYKAMKDQKENKLGPNLLQTIDNYNFAPGPNIIVN